MSTEAVAQAAVAAAAAAVLQPEGEIDDATTVQEDGPLEAATTTTSSQEKEEEEDKKMPATDTSSNLPNLPQPTGNSLLECDDIVLVQTDPRLSSPAIAAFGGRTHDQIERRKRLFAAKRYFETPGLELPERKKMGEC